MQAALLPVSPALSPRRDESIAEAADFHSCWSALPEAIRCRIEQAVTTSAMPSMFSYRLGPAASPSIPLAV